MALKFSHGQQILDAHLVDGELAGKRAGNRIAFEPEDPAGGLPHVESVDDDQFVDIFQVGQKIQTEGAAIDESDLRRKPEAGRQRRNGLYAEAVVTHQGIAQAKDQNLHYCSSGST